MSYLKDSIASYVIECGTRYDYILEKWFFHGLIRVPTDGYFSLTATDGVNTITEYMLESHPSYYSVPKTPADSITGIAGTFSGLYVNCIGFSGSMATSDNVNVPDFVLTLTPGEETPFVLTSVSSTCRYGSGADDWASVAVAGAIDQGWGASTTPCIDAWDNGTETPNIRLRNSMAASDNIGTTSYAFYTMTTLGHRCTSLSIGGVHSWYTPTGNHFVPIFNSGSPLTYYTGDTPVGSLSTVKVSTQRRLTWDFSPADYTVAAASFYNDALRA